MQCELMCKDLEMVDRIPWGEVLLAIEIPKQDKDDEIENKSESLRKLFLKPRDKYARTWRLDRDSQSNSCFRRIFMMFFLSTLVFLFIFLYSVINGSSSFTSLRKPVLKSKWFVVKESFLYFLILTSTLYDLCSKLVLKIMGKIRFYQYLSQD